MKSYRELRKVGREWKVKLPLKFVGENEDMSPEGILSVGLRVVKVLREHRGDMQRVGVKEKEIDDLIMEFESVDNKDEFNNSLNTLYDIGDEHSIWVGV